MAWLTRQTQTIRHPGDAAVKHLKTVLSYLGIIAIGGIAPHVPGWCKGAYTEGVLSAPPERPHEPPASQ